MMYGLQLFLLYSGVYILWRAARLFIDFKAKPALFLLLCLILFIPQVFIYSLDIQKDNSFAYSFLCVAALLSYFTLSRKKPTWPYVIAMGILLIYGIGVKYQAQFCAPILMIWLAYVWIKSENLARACLKSIAFALTVYGGIFTFNTILVPDSKKSNGWEYVKLFDLAALSLATQEDLIPLFNKTPTYSFEKMQQRFQKNAVDPYVYSQDNIFQKSKNAQQQDVLWMAWAKAALHHPFFYLQHRFVTFSHCIMGRVRFDVFEKQAFSLLGMPYQEHGILKHIISGVGYLFLSQSVIVFIGFIYFIGALINIRRSRFAPILLGFTSLAFIMMGILFFMSMAGTPRYTYISVVMIQACHLFAYGMYRDLKTMKKIPGKTNQ